MRRSGEPPAAPPPELGERARGRRERAARVGAPHLVPSLVAIAAALAVWALWGKVSCGDPRVALGSPETQVKAALAKQDRARVPDVYGFRAGGVASLRSVRFADVVVAMDGGKARVLAVVEAEGDVAWQDEGARISYVGREAFEMTRCSAAGWCADGRQFAELKGVLAALFRREDAFNRRDPEAYARLVSERYAGNGGRDALLARLGEDLRADPPARVRIHAWQIRVERDRAIVGEDQELTIGDGPPRTLRARYELLREGERWAIVSGL
ncbi:nuclear transport factor 2 family protein [Anaeromyxobacter terrae]|uniref:nuclear transport factor 2 family protein n=1 Tax=Anaeromyxobacter terrae TaxID=2925406 RepID=UPI001F56893A|nr:nuclear transport factor 2 family protein [Anaeromyxobacter sp. SG22]